MSEALFGHPTFQKPPVMDLRVLRESRWLHLLAFAKTAGYGFASASQKPLVRFTGTSEKPLVRFARASQKPLVRFARTSQKLLLKAAVHMPHLVNI